MTKKSTKNRRPTISIDWRGIVTDPVLQSVLAVLVAIAGLITLLALFGVTRGRLTDAWTDWLRLCFGWGVLPISLAILGGALLWLAHQMDRPMRWRWRPFVGLELAFFCLLALSHAVSVWIGRYDAWSLVEDRRWAGGGITGWAVYVVLAEFLGLGPFLTACIVFALFLVGLALAFDVTRDDVKRAVLAVWGVLRSRPLRQPVSPLPPERSRQPQAPSPARAQPVERRREPPPARVEPASQAHPISITHEAKPAPARIEPQPQAVPAAAPISAPREFVLPSLDLLNEPEGPVLTDEEIRARSAIIEDTLAQFGLPVEVAEVRVGPTVTQFGVRPGFVERSGAGGQRRRHKVRVSQISTLADDLALALAAPRLRIEAPVPGRSIVGIEVPNSKIQLVGVREVVESEEFGDVGSPLAFALGRDVAGEPVVADLARMPHLLIAGTTGSGKSVCIKTIAACLICSNTPEELRLVMIDPKMVELVRFNGLPHLYGRVEVDLERVVRVLRWVALEMDSRYKRFADITARNIDDFNRLMRRNGQPAIPRIVVLVDELADLMMLAPEEVERTICRIAQMARATGIHLVVATQRPSVDVVTGLIKANFPARISFATVSQIDSRVILDMPGAETLLGRGDMLYLAADAGYPVRVQGSYVSEEEVEAVVEFWRKQGGPMEEAPWERMMQASGTGLDQEEYGEDEDMLQRAVALVRSTGTASASLLQRRLRIGHPRAAQLMQKMEEMGIVGPPEAAGRTRRVIIGDKKG